MGILLSIIGGIFLIIFLKNTWKTNTDGIRLSDGTSENSEALDTIIEMEDQFFSEVQSGKKAVKFMHLFYQNDIIIIKSMLQSCGIPYRTENEHLPSVLAGIGVTGFNHTDFYILQDDYEEAFRIVTEYAEHKRTAATPDGAIKTAADIITVIAAAGYVPGKDETAGIVVFKYDE